MPKVSTAKERQWTRMWGQRTEKAVAELFAFIRVHSRLKNWLGSICFMEESELKSDDAKLGVPRGPVHQTDSMIATQIHALFGVHCKAVVRPH